MRTCRRAAAHIILYTMHKNVRVGQSAGLHNERGGGGGGGGGDWADGRRSTDGRPSADQRRKCAGVVVAALCGCGVGWKHAARVRGTEQQHTQKMVDAFMIHVRAYIAHSCSELRYYF